MPKQTQVEKILARLQEGPLTQMEAITEIGCMRLGARVLELRNEGHDIRTTMVEVPARGGGTAHVARYRLHPRPVAPAFELCAPVGHA